MVSPLLAIAMLQSKPWLEFPGPGKRVVLLAGDEEYRSEEMLPQLAKILNKRHGFHCTVLFSIGKDGTIDPNRRDHQPGIEALQTADLCVMMLRFRAWPQDQMRSFVDYYRSGRPILALRTSTHAFDFNTESPFARFSWSSKSNPGGFGKQVLGETWISHWGVHGKQATRGGSVASHPVLTGVKDVFGTTDVYEAHPPADSVVLMRGEVVEGMEPSAPQAAGRKKNALGVEQGLNEPMMPIVWLRRHRNEVGNTNLVMTCTMGAATDLLNEGFRRLLVNGCYFLTGGQSRIQDKMDVSLVGNYEPSPFGFEGFRKGVRPADLASMR
ncbi:MAG TPA: hypothetical protein PKA27_11910 [Fimbriimonadaceae bacterium]|nr:hypothetical protein [Fimbriimonadaceae bacterium]